MNTDTMQGKWRQLKGEALIRWGKLTHDDLDQVEGSAEKLIGKLQERYGYARDRAASEVKEFQGHWVKEEKQDEQSGEAVAVGGRKAPNPRERGKRGDER